MLADRMDDAMVDWKVCMLVGWLGASMVVSMVAVRVGKKADQSVHNSVE